MSRFDYDVVFFRVFCVTLLVVAFTFTVILTNVFVDIDGLLSIKKKNTPDSLDVSETFVNEEDTLKGETKYIKFNEYKNHDNDISPLFRTKRSIESEPIIHIKNPAVKKMLSRRLANLLEEIDKEEQDAKKEQKLETTTAKKLEVTKDKDNSASIIRNDDLLHLALHNILLKGLIGHMDINHVYKKVHMLVQTLNKGSENKISADEKLKILNAIVDSKEILNESRDKNKMHNNDEHKLFEEFMKCKKLEEQIAKTTPFNEISTTSKNFIRKEDKVFIKTIIEINEDKDIFKKPNKTHLNENIEGLIKLIYNGKSIKINQMHDDSKSPNNNSRNNNIVNPENSHNYSNTYTAESKSSELNHNIHRNKPTPLLNTVLDEYLKKLSIQNYEYLQNSREIEKIKTQRLKRQIKIRYLNNVTTLSKTKSMHGRESKDDDDLYIEIETHLDGKGIKGEKKKKLVRSLIDKIQKALRSDIEKKHNSVEHIKFVKRTQDPIANQINISPPKKILPVDPIEHRQLDPIGKSSGPLENIVDRHGNTWKKQYKGPNFLSISKSVNSAEMNELNIDYDQVIRRNGFSKRLQKPLNTETGDNDDSSEVLDSNSDNVTFILKNIAGSGFSIGFNQYKGEPPDKESMKMFNGLENLIREYHRTYDNTHKIISSESAVNHDHNFIENGHEIGKRNVEKLHTIYRRSIPNYYNINIFKSFFKENPSFNKYLNIFKRSNDTYNFHKNEIYDAPSNDVSLKEVPIIVDERILNKKLKPSEILTIANLVNLANRRRRSLNVKKISNLKSKIKLNRFLNTKAMVNKKVILMKKRNKRQVNNIRIIAKDISKMQQKNSEENIFFISRENTYSDKETMIRAVETADSKINKYNQYYDEEIPFDNIYRIQSPYIPSRLNENVYSTAIKSNRLMSLYPHIFLDKNSNSKEEAYLNKYQMNDKPYRTEPSSKPVIGYQYSKTTTEHNLVRVLQNLSVPKDEEIRGAMMPSLAGSDYKITVKMSPKNKTNTNARFKEIHTIVNKSFDENGFRYYTLLNMSQISKIETLNKTHDTRGASLNYNDQQKQIKALLKLHKKNIDRQLNSLITESNHLEKIIESNRMYNIDGTVKLLRNDGSSLEAKNEENLSFVKHLDPINNTETTSFTTMSPAFSGLAHTIVILPTTTEIPKINKSSENQTLSGSRLTFSVPFYPRLGPESLIIDTIKQNEKVTFEILNKIDTNTEILQTFLKKISNKLDLDKELSNVKTTEKPTFEMKLNLSRDWKTHAESKDFLPIPSELKNDTIPFIYAYQQSIPMINKTPSQLWASLIYQGHIQPKPVQNTTKNNFKKPALQKESTAFIKKEKNFKEPELLLNDLNNFKIVTNKERVISANIKINTTKV